MRSTLSERATHLRAKAGPRAAPQLRNVCRGETSGQLACNPFHSTGHAQALSARQSCIATHAPRLFFRKLVTRWSALPLANPAVWLLALIPKVVDPSSCPSSRAAERKRGISRDRWRTPEHLADLILLRAPEGARVVSILPWPWVACSAPRSLQLRIGPRENVQGCKYGGFEVSQGAAGLRRDPKGESDSKCGEVIRSAASTTLDAPKSPHCMTRGQVADGGNQFRGFVALFEGGIGAVHTGWAPMAPPPSIVSSTLTTAEQRIADAGLSVERWRRPISLSRRNEHLRIGEFVEAVPVWVAAGGRGQGHSPPRPGHPMMPVIHRPRHDWRAHPLPDGAIRWVAADCPGSDPLCELRNTGLTSLSWAILTEVVPFEGRAGCSGRRGSGPGARAKGRGMDPQRTRVLARACPAEAFFMALRMVKDQDERQGDDLGVCLSPSRLWLSRLKRADGDTSVWDLLRDRSLQQLVPEGPADPCLLTPALEFLLVEILRKPPYHPVCGKQPYKYAGTNDFYEWPQIREVEFGGSQQEIDRHQKVTPPSVITVRVSGGMDWCNIAKDFHPRESGPYTWFEFGTESGAMDRIEPEERDGSLVAGSPTISGRAAPRAKEPGCAGGTQRGSDRRQGKGSHQTKPSRPRAAFPSRRETGDWALHQLGRMAATPRTNPAHLRTLGDCGVAQWAASPPPAPGTGRAWIRGNHRPKASSSVKPRLSDVACNPGPG
eukprot:gene12771-biopygen10341